MPDRHSGKVDSVAEARPLVRRFAVASGSFVALLCLFQHVPVSAAALRGGVVYLAVLIVGKAGVAALLFSLNWDRRAEGEKQKP
jgi:hypothetical protein